MKVGSEGAVCPHFFSKEFFKKRLEKFSYFQIDNLRNVMYGCTNDVVQ